MGLVPVLGLHRKLRRKLQCRCDEGGGKREGGAGSLDLYGRTR